MAIIFDLDQTLIDSSSALVLRRNREWQEVYKMIPKLTPYTGISELIELLHIAKIPISIVTSSPESYCKKVIKQWKWGITTTICYHDTSHRKPHPEPINLAIKRLGITASDILAVGDDPNDIIAGRAAGVTTVGALWGATDIQAILREKPDYICTTVEDLRNMVLSRYKITVA